MSITLLGKKVSIPKDPSKAKLEGFPNPGVKQVSFVTHEFTSLCPKTGQPDYATVMIFYSPRKICLESKSLKLYLASYRNYGAFMEELSVKIYNDLRVFLQPKSLYVRIESVPRGGIALHAEQHSM